MKFGSYIITCQFESAACLSRFKGSALRGAFGHALRKVCCAQRLQSCGQCLLAGTCAYSYVFETDKKPTSSSLSKVNSRPHPYVLSPQDDGSSHFQSGDKLTFELLLFGDKAVELLPYIVYALMQMGKSGIGKGNKTGAGRFALTTVYHDGNEIYHNSQGELNHTIDVMTVRIEQDFSSCSTLSVDFLSPLRMKNNQRFVKKPDFQTLIRGALRRVSSLEDSYGDGYPDLDYKGLIDRAAEIHSDLTQTRWQETVRYSNRQKQKMNFGGVAGQAVYTGDLGEFMPILRYCEATHMGKQTAFGLGKIRLDPQP